MSLPTDPTPPARSATNSLATDVVIADDQGGMTILPADPEAFAHWVESYRRALRARAARKESENRGPGENKGP